MTAQDGVHIRRVDPAASAPVMVAARLTAELGAGHRVRLLGSDPDAARLRVTGLEPGQERSLAGRVGAILAQARFHGWILESPANEPAARDDGQRGRSSGLA